MQNLTNSVLSNLRPRPLSPDEVWDRVDPLRADPGFDPAQAGLGSLPYSKLSGSEFERLIYELLHSENQRPWFFGRSGQADFGVDIVTEVSGKQNIYQCKNYGVAPSWSMVLKAIEKFESEWLNDMSLPAPGEFVYCCPQPFDDIRLEWEKFKGDFQQRTGVALSFWDRNAIDSRLRRLPDLVAGLFSDSYAEHFCDCDEWRNDPWVRVQQGPARYQVINRFLDRHNRDAVYVAERQEKLFLAALDQNSTVSLRGLPGMGKSFLALELSCRLREPMRRIYYSTFKDATSVERLWQSARRRLGLPSLFVLDDCHLAPQALDNLLERLDPELRSGKLKLVLSIRDQVGGLTDQFDDTPAWLVRLKEEEAIINLRVDSARTLAVTCRLRPDFIGLSSFRLQQLQDACGGDLFLLEEILRDLNAPQDIDNVKVDGVLSSVRTYYFGGNQKLPTVTKLAALAQFDLVPRAEFFDGQWRPNEEALADPLMTRLFAPPRYQFLHSSLAKLVLRALAQLDTADESLNDTVAAITARAVREYLMHLSETTDGNGEFALAVHQFLRTQTQLSTDIGEVRMRSEVLADKTIQLAFERNFAKQSFNNLGLSVEWLAAGEHPAKEHYIELIQKRFRILFEQEDSVANIIGEGTVGESLAALRKLAPDTQEAVLKQYGAHAFLRLILRKGTLIDLFRVLQYSNPEFRTALLDQFTSKEADAFIDKTIASERSIGTLNLRMYQLRTADPQVLARLEHAIGAPGFLRLILANGTLFEMFRILQYSDPEFRTNLLDQLTSQQVETLIDKTIESSRSIGTLDLTMRELGNTDPQMLTRLERVVGAAGFVRLILVNGTLYELFRVLQYSTPEFRTALLDQLTFPQAKALIDKTVDSRRSIGTLDLTMRELGDTDPQVLARLERVIGAPSFLRLILANGTLFELFRVLQYGTPEFRTALLDQLTSQQAQTLIDKTIAAGRSVGTLELTMRELKDADPQMLAQLEHIIAARDFLRLIVANGTLVELFGVIQRATIEFRSALLDQLNAEQAATLLDKTITKTRRIESFHFTLRRLTITSNHLTLIEELLGVEGWWRLVISCGTLNSLSQITQAMSSDFRQRMIEAASNLSLSNWSELIARGFFRNACDFATKDVLSYPTLAREAFHAALKVTATPLVERASWVDLASSRLPEELAIESALLREALNTRMEAVQLNDLFDLDFRDAVNAFVCCWRERSDLRPELVKNLQKILPSRQTWPRDRGEVTALRLILLLARSTEFPLTELRWLLSEITAFLDPEVCKEAHTLPLLLLVWNMAAVSYDRELVSNLGNAFPHGTDELLISALARRVSPRQANQEKLWQIAFGGLLAFIFPNQKSRIIDLLRPLKGATRWLVKLAMDLTYLPAVFALVGIAVLTNRPRLFTPSICSQLLKKFEDYQDIGPAISALQVRISRMCKSVNRI